MSAPSKSLQFCRRALDQRSDFWAEQARAIYWQKPFSDVCRFDRPPFVRWFEGGETNLCYNAVDRYLEKRADQFAVHYLSTEVEAEKSYTYRQLHQEVCAFAAVLRSLGLQRSDRVVIYLPMIPEALFSMLACVRVGLVHSVVFAGFAAASLASRIDDAEAKLLITADAGLRGGKLVPLKALADEALALAKHRVERTLIYNRRIVKDLPWDSERDVDYAELRAKHFGAEVPCIWLRSEEPSYLLYTSGTTAQPKGIQRDTAGYAVALAASMDLVFGGTPGETDVHRRRRRVGSRTLLRRLWTAHSRDADGAL